MIKVKNLDVSTTLRSIMTATGFPGNSMVATLYGNPKVEIVKYAKEHNIDFIAMGSHGRKGWIVYWSEVQQLQ